jgi:6-pyruvoyl-tetrahydropterin synthase
MYEVGAAIELRAWHVMPGAEGPEGERHTHDYRLEVVVERSELDARGMVCDLDVLNAALDRTGDVVRDADLDQVIRPPDAEAVTVEIFARWAHDALSEAARSAGAEVLSVRVWESPVAFGGYSAPLR